MYAERIFLRFLRTCSAGGSRDTIACSQHFQPLFVIFRPFCALKEPYPGRLYVLGRANCFFRACDIVQGRKSFVSGGGLPGFEHSFK